MATKWVRSKIKAKKTKYKIDQRRILSKGVCKYTQLETCEHKYK